jgi:plasmid stabilization system protein ParE
VKVQFTPSARLQLLEAVAFIRSDKPSAARRFRDRVERELRKLEKFPEAGRLIPEFPDLPHREVVIGAYRFLYRPEKRVVWIVAVWHGAQQVPNPIEKKIL